MRITGPNTCTGGFVARRSATDIDVLTAGHCTEGSTAEWSARTTNGVVVVVGGGHSVFVNGCSTTPRLTGDAGLVHVRPSSNWDPRGFVYVEASASTVRDPSYSINATAIPIVGVFLCHTGAGGSLSDTDCGTVTSYPDAFQATTGRYYGGMAASTDLAVHFGDSGGPACKVGNAYGLVSHGAGGPARIMRVRPAESVTGTSMAVAPVEAEVAPVDVGDCAEWSAPAPTEPLVWRPIGDVVEVTVCRVDDHDGPILRGSFGAATAAILDQRPIVVAAPGEDLACPAGVVRRAGAATPSALPADDAPDGRAVRRHHNQRVHRCDRGRGAPPDLLRPAGEPAQPSRVNG